MRCHVVHFFCCAVELDSLTMIFAFAGAGFSFIACPLCIVFGGVFLHYFSLLCRVREEMQQVWFSSGRPIAWMSYIFVFRLPAQPIICLSSGLPYGEREFIWIQFTIRLQIHLYLGVKYLKRIPSLVDLHCPCDS